MKLFLDMRTSVLGSLSISAFAAKNSETVNLAQNVKVGTMKLAAGDWRKVTWTGTGSAVQESSAQKGKAWLVGGCCQNGRCEDPVMSRVRTDSNDWHNGSGID